MISAFSIKATAIHSCTMNIVNFHKIRVKIVKSDLPLLLQLYNNATPIVEEPNTHPSGVGTEAHDISLLDQGHSHPQLYNEHSQDRKSFVKGKEIELAIFGTAL